MAVYRLGEYAPEVHPAAWVADSAEVIGRVKLGADASVWYQSVLRGDNDLIAIGARTNLQDGCVLHADAGFPLTVGEGVIVGHKVMLHGCTIGDGALIGIGSIVLNGARIGRHCIVGAGALVTMGKTFPDGVLIVGSPAKVVRSLGPDEIARLAVNADEYVAQQRRHRSGRVRMDR